jgi:hypothetical protein
MPFRGVNYPRSAQTNAFSRTPTESLRNAYIRRLAADLLGESLRGALVAHHDRMIKETCGKAAPTARADADGGAVARSHDAAMFRSNALWPSRRFQ